MGSHGLQICEHSMGGDSQNGDRVIPQFFCGQKKVIFLLASVGGIWLYVHPFMFLWVKKQTAYTVGGRDEQRRS